MLRRIGFAYFIWLNFIIVKSGIEALVAPPMVEVQQTAAQQDAAMRFAADMAVADGLHRKLVRHHR